MSHRDQKQEREEQCPECFMQCWFCSDYIWMVRQLGCGARWTRGRKKEKPCPKSIPEKGKTCGTCGKPADMNCKNGGGAVIVERKIVASKLENL